MIVLCLQVILLALMKLQMQIMEMNNRLQEQESEDYYEHIVKGEYDEIDDNYGFSYDVILLKDNDFYEIFDVEGE